jgi:hypothetical protein
METEIRTTTKNAIKMSGILVFIGQDFGLNVVVFSFDLIAVRKNTNKNRKSCIEHTIIKHV